MLTGLDVLFNRLSDDLIEGSRQDDRLLGFGGADVINGNRGDRRSDGGYDDDGQTKWRHPSTAARAGTSTDRRKGWRTQEGSADTFVFSAKAKKANADKVKDFAVGDQIHLDSAVFKVLKTDGPLDQAHLRARSTCQGSRRSRDL